MVSTTFLVLLLLSAHPSNCVHQSSNATCARDPKSCLPKELVARIDELIPDLSIEAHTEDLPYACYLLHPGTIPRGEDCYTKCSDRDNGCPPTPKNGKHWQRVCDLYCPNATAAAVPPTKALAGYGSNGLQRNNSECMRNPKSCLSENVTALIDRLVPDLNIDVEDLPYGCYLFNPGTVPYGIECKDCSDQLFGCLNGNSRGEHRKKVCALFCPNTTTSSKPDGAGSGAGDAKSGSQTACSACLVRDPKTFLRQDLVVRIEELIPDLSIDDRAKNLPYICWLFHPATIPRGNDCLTKCSDRTFGCPTNQSRGDRWQKVCSFFCPDTKSLENKPSNSLPVRVENNGAITGKILIIIFCSLVLAMPSIIIVVVVVEFFRRWRASARASARNRASNKKFLLLLHSIIRNGFLICIFNLHF